MRNMPKCSLAVAVLLVVGTAAFAQEEQPKPPDVWPMADEAAALVAKKDFSGVKAAAEKIVAADPKQPIGYTFLIDACEALKDDGGVIAACEALSTAFPLAPDVKKPDPFRQHQLWHYHANRHKGEALFRAKKFDEAAACFQTAADLAFQAVREFDWRVTSRWQIQMKDRQADALWEAGKKDEAVELRRVILGRFDRDVRRCNNCVRVKAALIRNLTALGKADEAKQLLGETLADGRLDAVQKSWLEAEIDGKPSRRWSVTDALAIREDPDAFVIRSEGRFELRVNLAGNDRYAMITQWYDLETDPLREVDLQDDNFFTLLKPHHENYNELVDGTWKNVDYNRYVQLAKEGRLGVGYTKDQNAFEVIEKTPGRVRWKYTNRKWPGETIATTVYPDGRIYVGTHWTLMNPDKTIKIRSIGYYTGVSGTINWRTTIGKSTGMFGSPAISGQAPLTMMHSNECYPTVLDATRADVAKCLVRPTSSYGNNTLFLAWFRTPVQAGYKPDEQPEVDEAVFIHIWPNDRDSFEAALPYVQDYQDPARLDLAKGTPVTDDAGDYSKDGFNEAEGCYVVRADGNAVELTIDGSNVKRFSPVFKVLGIGKGLNDGLLVLDGRPLDKRETRAVQVDPESGTALVRVIGTISTKSKLEMRFVHVDKE